MTVNWVAAIVAGLIATVVMTVLMYMGKSMGMRMDLPRMLGLIFVGPESESAVLGIGWIAHLMMGVVFAIIYALILVALAIGGGWLVGAIFGAIHGVLVGLAMGMMPAVHPRMGPEKELPSPGLFAINYGSMVPIGVMVLHIIYGLLVGGLYPVI